MLRASRHLLVVVQTVLLAFVIPWTWLALDGPAGDASRRNALLMASGVLLVQGLVPAALLFVAERARIRVWIALPIAWALAVGPWFVDGLWWRAPFADMPRDPRLLSVGALTIVGILVATFVGIGLTRLRAPSWLERAARLHVVLVGLVVLAGAALGVTAIRGRTGDAGPGTPPDLVLMVADAMRRDVVGAHGGPPGITPEIDAWARTATVFDGAVANGPTSIPGHASLLSGSGVERHGAFTNFHVLADAPHGIAARLAARGYLTVGVCANQLISRRSGFADGFDLYWSTTQSRLEGAPFPLGILDVPVVNFVIEAFDVDVAALSIGIVAENLPEPFFLFAQVIHTHVPYQDRVGWTTPARVDSLTALYEAGELLNTTRHPDRDVAHFHATYLGAAHTVDRLLGALRRDTARRYGDGRVDWIFTADHGEILGEHGHEMIGQHEGPFNASLRIPLIADTPRRGEHVTGLTGQDRVAELAEWLAAPDARSLEDVMVRDRHFALTDSAYVLLSDSLKVVWSRERPEMTPTVHRWREDRFDREGVPIDQVPAAQTLFTELQELVDVTDLTARIETTEPLDEERLRALRALGYIE